MKYVKRTMSLLILLALVLAVVVAVFVLLGGKTHALHREISPSQQYTASDIRSAMWMVECRFRLGFRGCSLLELTYDEEFSADRGREWAEQYGAEEAIVLTSSFEVGESGPVTLNPNSTYRNWQWILTRSGGGFWKLRTSGYG